MKMSIPPRQWLLLGYAVTLPTLIFWCAVAYTHLFHNPKYIDALLTFGGSYSHIIFKVILPVISLLIAVNCRKILRRQAIASNLWHRETPVMRTNERLMNWDVLLIAIMIISLINN